jgi:hypothetical protein
VTLSLVVRKKTGENVMGGGCAAEVGADSAETATARAAGPSGPVTVFTLCADGDPATATVTAAANVSTTATDITRRVRDRARVTMARSSSADGAGAGAIWSTSRLNSEFIHPRSLGEVRSFTSR